MQPSKSERIDRAGARTVRDAAKLLSVSQSKVTKMIAEGVIDGYKVTDGRTSKLFIGPQEWARLENCVDNKIWPIPPFHPNEDLRTASLELERGDAIELNNRSVELDKNGGLREQREAVQMMARAHKLDPYNEAIRENRIVIATNFTNELLKNKSYQEVIEILSQMQEEGLVNGQVYDHLCRAYQGSGLIDQSIEAARKSVESEPRNPWYYHHLATSYLDKDGEEGREATISAAGHLSKMYQLGIEQEDEAVQRTASMSFLSLALKALAFQDFQLMRDQITSAVSIDLTVRVMARAEICRGLSIIRAFGNEYDTKQRDFIDEVLDSFYFQLGDPYYHLTTAEVHRAKFLIQGRDRSNIIEGAKQIGQAYLAMSDGDLLARKYIAREFLELAKTAPRDRKFIEELLIPALGVDREEFFEFFLREVAKETKVSYEETLAQFDVTPERGIESLITPIEKRSRIKWPFRFWNGH
jgi:excisionase family DNA binding protein